MSLCTAFAVKSFDGNYLTSYPMTIITFDLSLTVYKTFANQEKYQTELEKEGKN